MRGQEQNAFHPRSEEASLTGIALSGHNDIVNTSGALSLGFVERSPPFAG